MRQSSAHKQFLRLARITRPESDPSTQFPVHQVGYLNRAANAVAHYPFGMHANPGVDAHALMFAISGNGEARVVMPASPEERPELAEGEVAWFHPATGTLLHFKADGSIAITSAVGVTINGDLTVTGDLTAQGALAHEGSTLGLFGSTPVVQPTITGSTSGGTSQLDYLTEMDTLGLWIDAT